LPHREERRKRARQHFGILAGLAAVIGIAIVGAVHFVNSQRIDDQSNRNAFLKGEIAKLDKQIDEIKKLKEQTSALLARKRVVESLQSNRTEAVRLLDQLVRQLPDGLYLKQVKQTGELVNVMGYATSNARVSTLMRNFEASPWLEDPKLVEIKAVKVNNANLNEFNLNVKVTRPKEEVEDQKKPGAAPQPPKQG